MEEDTTSMEHATASDLCDNCCGSSINSINGNGNSSKDKCSTTGSFIFSAQKYDDSSNSIGVIACGVEGARKGQVNEEGQAQPQTAEEHHDRKSCTSSSRQQGGSNNNITISSYSTTSAASARSNIHSFSYSPPLNRRVEDDDDVLPKDETASYLHCPPPAAHSTTNTGATGTAAAVFFPGSNYSPSSSFARKRNSSSNNSSSSSSTAAQKQPPRPLEVGQEYGKKSRRWIDPSTIQALRSCATYVTQVKASLLTSNHEEKYNAFIDLLCSWRDQGLSSQEVFSQMQLILQDVSPELLAAFTAFLPIDTQEEARLHLAASTRMSVRGAQEDIEDASSSPDDSCLATTYNAAARIKDAVNFAPPSHC